MDEETELELEYVCRDIADRQRYRRGPKGIAGLINDLMARQGYGQMRTANRCLEAWAGSVGEMMAGHTRPGNVRRGVLEVFVRNSALLQELTFQKKKILGELTRRAPELKIRDVRFRVGNVD